VLGSRSLWRVLGWGHDPWWDVAGRSARRRARRRLLDLVLAGLAAALIAGTVGARVEGADGTSGPAPAASAAAQR
jgi:hypothetical protein